MTKEEFDRRIKALLISHEKTLLEVNALKESQKKTDEIIKATRIELLEMFKKTDEQIKKTDEQIKKTDLELRAMFEKTDEEFEKLKVMFEKTDEEFEKTRKLVAGISNGWGRLTEGYAIASFEKIFSNIGIPIKDISTRRKRKKGGELIELDLLSIGEKNGKEIVVVIEVKTYLRIEDIKNFLKDLERFYDFFEEYRKLELIGGIAFMNPSKNAKAYAEKNGLYLLSLSEDTMTLANSRNFKPRVYRYKHL